jgi:hypothetical protein
VSGWNTKLLGFDNEKIVLERWGRQAYVPLPRDSLGAIREACHRDLPTQPPEEKDPWQFSYMGHGLIGNGTLTVDQAQEIIDVLSLGELESGEWMTLFVEDLERAIQLRKDELDAEGEPGLG